MRDDRCEILARVAERTLEDLAFLFSTPEDPGEKLGDPDPAVVAIGFSGPLQGRVVLALSKAALAELACNMLGIAEDEEADPEQQQDALRELLNIICGNLMPEIAGPRAVFNLTPPEVVDAAALESGSPSGRVCLTLDAGRAELLLFECDDPRKSG